MNRFFNYRIFVGGGPLLSIALFAASLFYLWDPILSALVPVDADGTAALPGLSVRTFIHIPVHTYRWDAQALSTQ